MMSSKNKIRHGLMTIIILLVSACATPQYYYTFDNKSMHQDSKWEEIRVAMWNGYSDRQKNKTNMVRWEKNLALWQKNMALWQEKATIWQENMVSWQKKATFSVQHTVGNAGMGWTAFAQSFIPLTKQIKAVQLKLYPTRESSGWIRIEITKDGNGLPGHVLARSWLKLNENCPVPHGGYIAFPVGNINVKANDTYWITAVEFKEKKYQITNLGFADFPKSDNDSYVEGELLLPYVRQGVRDANFRIISSYEGLPGIKEASQAEIKTLPPLNCQEASWQNINNSCKNLKSLDSIKPTN